MSFEAILLLKAFVAPLAVSSVVAWLWCRYARAATAATLGVRIQVGLAWWLGSFVVLAIQVQSLWFEETWQQADYLLWIVALASCFVSQKSRAVGAWLLSGSLVVIVLYASLPRGEGWNDMATTKYCWLVLGIIAWLANSRCWPLEVDEPDSTTSGRLVWIGIVYQTALTICAFSCYASLGEWSLSLLAITIPLAVLASRCSVGCMRTVLWQVFTVGSLVAISSVLYGADPWAVALAVSLPTLVSFVDRGCQLFLINRTRRIWMTAIGASLLLLVDVVLICIR